MDAAQPTSILETDEKHGASERKPEKEDLGAVDTSIDPENEITGVKLLLIHTGICLCTFLVGLDFTLIATAVPVITSRFNSLKDIGWYGGAFYMALCASQPLAGKTYILFPKKVTYLFYVLIFEIGSLICALAPTSAALIAGRVITGLGASGIFAGGFAILTTIIPLHKRAIWTGTLSSTFAIASIIGPVIGGAFTQHVSWRWCFYINLPVGGFAVTIFFFVFHVKRAATEDATLREKLAHLDGIGFTLFSGAIVMLLLALQWGGSQYSWGSLTIIGCFVGFGIVSGVFIAWEIHMKDYAMITPKLFNNRNVWLICASAFFVNGPFQIIVYWLPLWFQGVLGVSPTTSGIYYLPTVIADVLASFIGAGIVMKLGVWNPFLLFAEALVCLGSGLLSALYPNITDGHWIGYQILGGAGYSLATNLAHLGMQASLPKELVPLGASFLLMVISTSCAIFLAIGQALFQERLVANLSRVTSLQTVADILAVGATRFRDVLQSPDSQSIVKAYSDSITQVFYIPGVAPALSFFLVVCCRWTSLNKPEKAKESDTENGKN
ncbi:MFS general substrate transporter [Periconia macrospinosa]|uniref:MFS general substrate transporter n=1 Tax=Periconia macrospinosa TaxID=97972 RepID=A0A2V1E0E3_9PLEO|nr:MFS general substrate transporter [Periconia macrospinosa]